MAADDLSAPLGRQTKRGRAVSAATIIASLPQAITIALAVFLCVFLLWAVLADNPFGGEPMTVTQISQQTAPRVVSGPAAREVPAPGPNAAGMAARYDGPPEGALSLPVPPSASQPPAPAIADGAANAGNTKTVTIIDGKTGARQEIVIPGMPEPPSTPEEPAAAAEVVPKRSEIGRSDPARAHPQNRRQWHASGGSVCAAG